MVSVVRWENTPVNGPRVRYLPSIQHKESDLIREEDAGFCLPERIYMPCVELSGRKEERKDS